LPALACGYLPPSLLFIVTVFGVEVVLLSALLPRLRDRRFKIRRLTLSSSTVLRPFWIAPEQCVVTRIDRERGIGDFPQAPGQNLG